MPKVWTSVSSIRTPEDFETAVKDCRAHGVDVMQCRKLKDENVCARYLEICRKYGMKLHLGAPDASKSPWLKKKTVSTGDNNFIEGFVSASFTVCIGAMAIVGSINDGLYGDITVLVTKAILDLIIIMVMAASLGKGTIFSAIPVAILQGSVTALSLLLKPIMTDAALLYLSVVGNILIFCVGINLVFGKKIKVANLLPAIIFAVICAFIPIDFI